MTYTMLPNTERLYDTNGDGMTFIGSFELNGVRYDVELDNEVPSRVCVIYGTGGGEWICEYDGNEEGEDETGVFAACNEIAANYRNRPRYRMIPGRIWQDACHHEDYVASIEFDGIQYDIDVFERSILCIRFGNANGESHLEGSDDDFPEGLLDVCQEVFRQLRPQPQEAAMPTVADTPRTWRPLASRAHPLQEGIGDYICSYEKDVSGTMYQFDVYRLGEVLRIGYRSPGDNGYVTVMHADFGGNRIYFTAAREAIAAMNESVQEDVVLLPCQQWVSAIEDDAQYVLSLEMPAATTGHPRVKGDLWLVCREQIYVILVQNSQEGRFVFYKSLVEENRDGYPYQHVRKALALDAERLQVLPARAWESWCNTEGVYKGSYLMSGGEKCDLYLFPDRSGAIIWGTDSRIAHFFTIGGLDSPTSEPRASARKFLDQQSGATSPPVPTLRNMVGKMLADLIEQHPNAMVIRGELLRRFNLWVPPDGENAVPNEGVKDFVMANWGARNLTERLPAPPRPPASPPPAPVAAPVPPPPADDPVVLEQEIGYDEVETGTATFSRRSWSTINVGLTRSELLEIIDGATDREDAEQKLIEYLEGEASQHASYDRSEGEDYDNHEVNDTDQRDYNLGDSIRLLRQFFDANPQHDPDHEEEETEEEGDDDDTDDDENEDMPEPQQEAETTAHTFVAVPPEAQVAFPQEEAVAAFLVANAEEIASAAARIFGVPERLIEEPPEPTEEEIDAAEAMGEAPAENSTQTTDQF